jgi:hypothetical protein
MRPDKEVLGKVYQVDPATGAFLVEVDLDRYEDVFNEWDPAPYKRRDLDPDLLTYLTESSLDIPLRYELSLSFTVPQEVSDLEKEKLVGDGIRNYFAFEARQTRRRLGGIYRTTCAYLVCAVGLLIATTYANRLPARGLILDILTQGVTIGAWVFAWECVSRLLFDHRQVRLDLRRLRRFERAMLCFAARPAARVPNAPPRPRPIQVFPQPKTRTGA